MQLHAGKSCRDGDQLADSGNQATDKSGECSVLVEIFFGMLHFGFIDQAHVSETAVGEELNIYLVVLFATLGANLGAIINYYLARWLGRLLRMEKE